MRTSRSTQEHDYLFISCKNTLLAIIALSLYHFNGPLNLATWGLKIQINEAMLSQQLAVVYAPDSKMDGQYFLRKYDNNCSIMTQKYAFFHRFRSDFTKVNRLYLILQGREGSIISIQVLQYIYFTKAVCYFLLLIFRKDI